MNALLTIASERAPNSPIMILRLIGRLDASTVNQLERAISEAQQAGVRAILVDMSQLVYVSSSGLRVLLSARSAIRKKGGDIFPVRAQPPRARGLRYGWLQRHFQPV